MEDIVIPKVGEVWRHEEYGDVRIIHVLENPHDDELPVVGIYIEDGMERLERFNLPSESIYSVTKTPAIRLEEGKLYRTRSGCKALCLHINYIGEAVFGIVGREEVNILFCDGKMNDDGTDHWMDIIGEWKDEDNE